MTFLKEEKEVKNVDEIIHFEPLTYKNGSVSQNMAAIWKIVIIAASGGAVRQLLIKAQERGMTNGDYAFFNIYLVSYKYYGENTWYMDDEYDDLARVAYERPQSRASSDGTVQHGQVFTTVATYKGIVVAVKHINTDKIDLSRSLLLELKHMRDLHHSNITSFVGACVDTPNICILMEYCSKGSLQDILQNDAIKLDWVFRSSLVQDIVSGLQYIHGSIVRCHGRLKSSNCVVDSRFVLKLTDFGLEKFRKEEVEAEKTHACYRKMLWCSPEILRQNDSQKGSQKGDVYSFGIILQEIVLRTEPFENPESDQTLTPQEIIAKVTKCEEPVFRPQIPDGACPAEIYTLMQRCWSELPEDRPDVPALKHTMSKINK
uniref:guanylate cyclase n=1 Tax=Saccoglossus kowalevskii TaxID=10224 RepID=A0ABM0LXQ7_SACKO|nr:PREDICTED: atrial natriuretic peptide receptor 2-like [Saccoglossus kowalevskii]